MTAQGIPLEDLPPAMREAARAAFTREYGAAATERILGKEGGSTRDSTPVRGVRGGRETAARASRTPDETDRREAPAVGFVLVNEYRSYWAGRGRWTDDETAAFRSQTAAALLHLSAVYPRAHVEYRDA